MTLPVISPGPGGCPLGPPASNGNPKSKGWLRGLGGLAVVALLAGCSTTTPAPASTTRPDAAALNVTPCNYARAWHDDRSHFGEFATLARFARTADSPELRADGRQLTSAVAAGDTAAVDHVTGQVYGTCQELGLVTAPSPGNASTG